MDDRSDLDDAPDTDAPPARHKLDASDYELMGRIGILKPEDRVELIDGEIIDMAPIGDDHVGTVNWLTRALVMACGDKAIVAVQNPVRLDRFNQPQPDFAVLRPRRDFYRTAGATAEDVLLLVEVADSSLGYDKRVKLPLYARFGIPDYWLVDLKARVLDVHRLEDGRYGEPSRPGADEQLPLAAAPNIVVPLDSLFG